MSLNSKGSIVESCSDKGTFLKDLTNPPREIISVFKNMRFHEILTCVMKEAFLTYFIDHHPEITEPFGGLSRRFENVDAIDKIKWLLFDLAPPLIDLRHV